MIQWASWITSLKLLSICRCARCYGDESLWVWAVVDVDNAMQRINGPIEEAEVPVEENHYLNGLGKVSNITITIMTNTTETIATNFAASSFLSHQKKKEKGKEANKMVKCFTCTKMQAAKD